jgi:hypothetical protein
MCIHLNRCSYVSRLAVSSQTESNHMGTSLVLIARPLQLIAGERSQRAVERRGSRGFAKKLGNIDGAYKPNKKLIVR